MSKSAETGLAELFEAARAAQGNAYAPYSGFKVGAALRAESATLYSGANVENAAYPEGVCAETSAISAMARAGGRRIREILVIGDGEGLCTPCGGCRQRIREFSDGGTRIYVAGPEGVRAEFTLEELLPRSFGPDHVSARSGGAGSLRESEGRPMEQGGNAAIAALKARGLESLPPLGVVLGTGLGAFADELSEAIAIPYVSIPGFPAPSVEGHAGRLVVGEIEGRAVALFQGRGHYYERGDANAMRGAIQTFRRLGGETLILTNAAGGLNKEWRPPALVAITDHINFAGANPLIGATGADRFVPLTRAYDETLLAELHAAARAAEIELNEGVYMWFSGPSFETPAEIRAARILGADLVGMSTVPEVILARQQGLRCAAVSVVTNYAAGLSGGDPSHDETQAVARQAADRFKRLLRGFIRAHKASGE